MLGVSEIHFSVRAGEILSENFKEFVSRVLKKCEMKSIKVSARLGNLINLTLSFG